MQTQSPRHGSFLHAPVGRVALIAAGYLAVAGGVLALRTHSAPSPEVSPQVLAGQTVWRSSNCEACHALYGLGGQTGPDLTNVLRVRGTNVVLATVREGRGDMPAFHHTDAEDQALVSYLAFLDTTGEYPMRERPLDIFGRSR